MAIIKKLKNTDDVDILKKIFLDYEDHSKFIRGDGSHKLLSRLYETSEIYEILSKIIAPIVGYEGIFPYRFTDFRSPCRMHTDGNFRLPSRLHPETYVEVNTSILIPLSWSPSEGVVHTLFFDQMSSDDFLQKHTVYGWSDEYDYSTVSDYTHKPFDENHHREFLSHEDINRFYGFSISDAVKWELGTAILFEPCRLHASSAFTTINEKVCLLIKTDTEYFDEV